ncbi:MAG: LacI family DNA-binding transcriptional regulator [Vallitaleaceae bacterium]|nr:LacI family DNA-binding transcriptional regulator [Vallitaleaceae bacterium]
MDKKTTIIDVAQLSGFSIATVSRVLNGNYPVKDSTREKVQKAIETLSFSPNVLARGLLGAKTYTIGIIVPSLENLFFTELIRGIDEILLANEYTAFICSTNDDLELEKKHMTNLIDRRVDGIISISPEMKMIGKEYESISKSLPVILVNGEHDGYDCHFVSSDQATGTIKALEYLIEEGHGKIAFLRGHNTYSYNLKENLYRRLLPEHAIELEESLIIRINAGNSLATIDESCEAVLTCLKKRKDITAIFSCNDLMAVGALKASVQLGKRIPEELRIIGFDNTITCSITQPTLSSVDQKMRILGTTAANNILALIAGNDANSQKKVILETQLIIRNT